MNIARCTQSILFALFVTCISTMSTAQVEDTAAARIAAQFSHLAGGDENAMALVLALHSGAPVRLAAIGEESRVVPEMVSLDLPTAPMAWNDVRVSLLNAQDQLVRAGIVRPSLEDLHAALLGGQVSASDGAPLVLRGVLQMRAEGLSWLDIARASDALPAARTVSAPR
jgi:hypothetical protein